MKKIISLLVIVAMLMAMAPVAFAADDVETKTVYFQNNWLWTDIHCYYWTDEGNNGWPGEAMTLVENDGTYDIYSVEIPANAIGLVINGIKNDGSGYRDQTPDITDIRTDICYCMKWDNGNKVDAADYCVHPTTEAQDNYDGKTHNVVCSCGITIEEEVPHEYENGECACGMIQPGTEQNPIMLNFEWNSTWTEGTSTVTAPVGTTYYSVYNANGMLLSINDAEPTVLTSANPRMPATITITNEGDAPAEYTLKLTYPEGHMNNPAQLTAENTWGSYHNATIEAGSRGYFYTWTAAKAGKLTLEIYAYDADWNTCGWTYVVNNPTAGSYGENQLSTDHENTSTYTVSAGDEIEIMVNTFNLEDSWNAPAGQITLIAYFECDPHGDSEAKPSGDSETHNLVCTVCGAVVGTENHNFVDGVCTGCSDIKQGTEENPIFPDFQWNDEWTEATATVTVPVGTTYYAAYAAGMELSINGEWPFLLTAEGMGRMPAVFSITNDGDAPAEYTLKLTYPLGNMNNPAELETSVDGYFNYAGITEGSQGYFFTWTAPATGTLTLNITAEDANWNPMGWSYFVNNMTTYSYGDTQWSDSEPVVNPAVITVTEGNVYQIMVNTYDPANPWTAPAGDVYVTASFVCDTHDNTRLVDNGDGTHSDTCIACGAAVKTEEHTFVEGTCACEAAQPGTESNPMDLSQDLLWEEDYAASVMIPAGETWYFMANGLNGMIMSINGGEGITCVQSSFFAPYTWSITNDKGVATKYDIVVTFPVGAFQNPAELVMGENSHQAEEGAMEYYYTWTAPSAGTLIITMPESGWFYCINNQTTDAYGDGQWPDSDPVVNPATITVAQGDEIQIVVNTYDPEMPWVAPAGTLTFTAEFDAEGDDTDTPDNPENPDDPENPDAPVEGDVVDEGKASAGTDSKDMVRFETDVAGTLTITVGDGSCEWVSDVYSLSTWSVVESASGTDQKIYTVEVEAGSYYVRFYGPGEPCAAISNVPYVITFEATGEEPSDEPELPEYVEMESVFDKEGCYNLDHEGVEAVTVLYTFAPDATGIYEIELLYGDVDMSLLANFTYVELGKGDKLTVTCTEVGQSWLIGFTGEDVMPQIRITKTGEASTEPSYETIIYENEQTPVEFDETLYENITHVNVNDATIDKAVLGEDGYYHLNTADGPILYVDFFGIEPSIGIAWGYGNSSYAVMEGDEIKQVIKYSEALAAYMMAENVGGNYSYGNNYHPLTADLMEMLQNIGANNGWYDENGLVGNSEDAWMFSLVTMDLIEDDEPTTEPDEDDKPTTEPDEDDKPTTEPDEDDEPTTEPDEDDEPTTEPDEDDKPTTEPDEDDEPTTEPDEDDKPTTEPDEDDEPTTEPDEDDEPTTDPDEDEDKNPETGDRALLSVACAIALVSAMSVVALPAAKKRFF